MDANANDYRQWSDTAVGGAERMAKNAEYATKSARFYRGNARSSELRGDNAIAELYEKLAGNCELVTTIFNESGQFAEELAGLLWDIAEEKS